MLNRAMHVVVAVTLLVALWGGQAASGQRGTQAAGVAGPKQYYLALGDSLAYGYQPNGDYTHGYADDFLQYLQSNGSPQLQLVNMACPGETTTTFMNGGCSHANMVKYPWGVSNGVTITNQLAGALTFIQQHPGQVGPVTIDIGVNDIITDIDPVNCLTRPRILTDATQAISNFTGILSQLNSALNGTGDILTINYYDPYQLANSNTCQAVVQLTQAFNAQLQAAANNAGIPMADVFTAFGGDVLPPPSTGTATATPTTGPGTATATPTPSNPLCTYTWFCSASDVHPTTAGYAAIANAIEQIPYPPATPTPTLTATPIPVCNPTLTPATTGTATVSPTPTRRLLRSPTPANTATPTVPPPTCTPSPSPTSTATPTSTAAGATNSPSATSTAAPTNTPEPKYYLALGDSLAYGYQPNGDYTHGYADDLFTQYLQPRGFTALVNMSCPNETSVTFMQGGCPSQNLVKSPWGITNGVPITNQLAAGLNFIQAHPGQVKLVTINVGAADVLPDIDTTTCTANINALTDGLTALNNVTNIVQQLKSALNGQGDLATITYYDPFQNQCPNLDSLTTYLNLQIKQKAQQYGLLPADVYAAFGGATTPNPNLCNYTWICSNPSTVDATTQGYSVIEGAFETALNYPLPPTSTPTGTATATPTSTVTPGGPTLTPTNTSLPPSATAIPSATATSGPSATPSPTNTPAPAYYLALGDSLAYGFQPNGDYTHGYADDLFTQYLKPRGFTALVNMSCPNETSATFMNGGCANAVPPVPLKYSWGSANSQLAAALAFIQAHPGQVKLVTINVGAADVLPDIDTSSCTANSNALTDGLNALNNVTSTIQKLQNALNGQGRLATITYYDPFQIKCPGLDSLTTFLNGQIQQQAQLYGLTVADVYTAFGGTHEDLCTYTWICPSSAPSTVDATTIGYNTIAAAFGSALGYPPPAPTATPNTGVPPQPTQAPAGATGTAAAYTPTMAANSKATATFTPSPGGLVGPKKYYLALGDSLAYGYQPNGDYKHAYADDFFQYLKPLGTTTLVNMACPKETTVTFMNGKCPRQSMVKTSYGANPSQLAAAIAFIKAHPGQVSPVTINVGAQDILSDFDLKHCTNTPALYHDLPNAIANFKNILKQLKSALNGKGDLITLTYYNPYAQQCTDLAPLGQQLNQPITDTARQDGVLLADVFGAFGGITAPNPRVCNLTWICSTPSTIDATTAGHALIAHAIEAVVHYSRVTSGTGPCPSKPPKKTPPLKVKFKQRSIASGNNLSLSINTIAHARITVTLLLQKTKITTTGKGKKKKTHKQTITLYRSTATLTANAHGLSSGHLRITYRPSKAVQVPLHVTIAQGCNKATFSGKVTVTPAAKAKPKAKVKAKTRHT